MTNRLSRVTYDGFEELGTLVFCPSCDIGKFHATRFVRSPPLGSYRLGGVDFNYLL